jgi:hypothetical protein
MYQVKSKKLKNLSSSNKSKGKSIKKKSIKKRSIKKRSIKKRSIKKRSIKKRSIKKRSIKKKNLVSKQRYPQYNCEDDFITYEPIQKPYVSIGNDMCVSCEQVHNIRNQNIDEFNDDPIKKIFYENGTPSQRIMFRDQLDDICGIDTSTFEIKTHHAPKQEKKEEKTIWSGIEVLSNPTDYQKVVLINNINRDPLPDICSNNVKLSYVLGSVNRANIILYAYDIKQDGNKYIRSIILAYPNPDNNTDMYMDVICSRERGDGWNLLQEFIKLIKHKYTQISLQTVEDKTGTLIASYQRWGFILQSKYCSNKCYMIKYI